MKTIINNGIIGRGIGIFSKWTDVLYTNGFHVQHYKKSYRIVNKYNQVFFNGNKIDTFKKIEKIRKYKNKKENIMLIHGYANAYTIMSPMKKYLSSYENRYNIFDVRYASTYLSLEQIVKDLSLVVKYTEEPINIIAHSLGGLIAMELKKLYPEKIRKIILIASPINGSKTAKYFNKLKPEKVSGPIIKDLIKGVTPYPCELYIINCFTKGINKSALFREDNDGVVSISETLPPLIKYQLFTLKNSHTAIMKDKKMFHIIKEIFQLSKLKS